MPLDGDQARLSAPGLAISQLGLLAPGAARAFPSCRIGASIRIPVAALRAWAEAQTQLPTSDAAMGKE